MESYQVDFEAAVEIVAGAETAATRNCGCLICGDSVEAGLDVVHFRWTEIAVKVKLVSVD